MNTLRAFRVYVALAVIAWAAVAIQVQILTARGVTTVRLVLLGLWIFLAIGYSVWAYLIRRKSDPGE